MRQILTSSGIGRVAKITRPGMKNVLARERLFQQLDDGWGKSLAWVCGPPGAGKTTLVGSWLDARALPCLWYQVDEGDADIATFFYYMGLAARKLGQQGQAPLPLLTPEYLLGVPAFTRRYFENLFSRLDPPYTIVFDNYQAVACPSFHEMLNHALDVIPEGICVVVLSRQDPPPQLARLRANNRMHLLGWNDIRLTAAESAELVRIIDGNELPDETLAQLHEKTDGWTAGLLLMIRSARAHKLDYRHLPEMKQREVFDYFAGEVFDRADEETRLFLLRTSFLPSMSARMAGKLAGDMDGAAQAGRILRYLSEHHCFIEKHYTPEPVFQHHPLFAEFLQTRARNALGKEELAALQHKAATLLAEEGQGEEAARLFRDSGDVQGLVSLVLSQAQPMVMQGRRKTLEEWLDFIPDAIRDSTPRLLYWRGVCRLLYAPAQARIALEQAFHLFEQEGDEAGALLAWAGIAISFAYEWNDFTPLDGWIDWLDERVARNPVFPSPQIETRVATGMACALMFRRPHHPGISGWFERAQAVTQQCCTESCMETCLHALTYYFWMGDKQKFILVGQTSLLSSAAPCVLPSSIFIGLFHQASAAMWLRGDAAQALQEIAVALDLARSSGIHIWDHLLYAGGVYGALVNGDMPLAADYLKKMALTLNSAQRYGYCHYNYLVAWHCLLLGDTATALVHADMAVTLAVETGMVFAELVCRLEAAIIADEIGEHRRASEELAFARELARQTKSTGLEFSCLMVKALLSLGAGEMPGQLEPLRKAMAMGREQGYIGMCWWCYPSMMSRLCAQALENDIEVEYAQMLIRTYKLAPPEGHCTESWPYTVKIHTLGRFALEVDGKLVSFSGKMQKKPIELLKALIAFGGVDVPESLLSDTLWPDADGDAAHQSFKFTLHSLRKLLGNADALNLCGGRISIDQRLCWVDVLSLNALLEQARVADIERINHPSAKEASGREEYARLHEKAVQQHKGDFLPGDDSTWAIAARKQIRDKLARLPAEWR